MPDPLERLTNLVALLLETKVPLTLTNIVDSLDGQYPDGESARLAAFNRDKQALRAAGIPLEQEVLAGDQAGATGYWIDRKQYELGDLGLTDDERQALQVAVATVHLGPDWAETAIMKLGGTVDAGPERWASTLTTNDLLPPLFDAVNSRSPVSFRYRDQDRVLEPWGLAARGGFWYVVGLDRGAGERRTYRVDRIDGEVELGAADGFERPAGFDAGAAVTEGIKHIGEGDGPTEALVAVDADRARAVLTDLGEGAVVRRDPDGSIVVRVPCANRLVFRAWLLGFVEHAEVLEPVEVRNEIVTWLDAMVRRG